MPNDNPAAATAAVTRFTPGATEVPRSALTLRAAAAMKFGDNGENAKTAPVEMVARSGQPIEHWFWGRVVHDMAGMKLAKKSLPIDYAHDDAEVLGYLNKFDVSTGDLVVSGALIPFTADDRAAEVIFKQKAGVPYEASINFCGDGMTYEYIAEGQVTAVNGYQFEGPGIVIREWPLRGVAICPYGADGNTSTSVQFSQSDTVKVAVLNTQTKENVMSTTTTVEAGKPAVDAAKTLTDKPAKEATPAGAVELTGTAKPETEAPAVTPPAAVDVTKLAADAPGKKFLDAFGDQGGVWFAQGKTFEEAQGLFTTGLKTANADLTAKVAELQTQLAATRGETTPSKFTPAPAAGAKPAAKGTEGSVAALSAVMTFPGQKK